MSEAGDKQRRMRDWIGPHVYYCASELVHELAQKSEYTDDLLEVCVQDDWQSPAEEAGITLIEGDDGWGYRTSDGEVVELGFGERDSVWQTACEDNNLDPYQDEAYEHWIVSQWFAERLIEKGEMVTKDFLGLTIWGRTCTGQAIIMDCVVEEIYDEMMARRG